MHISYTIYYQISNCFNFGYVYYTIPVSYTHLDVYKRQSLSLVTKASSYHLTPDISPDLYPVSVLSSVGLS